MTAQIGFRRKMTRLCGRSRFRQFHRLNSRRREQAAISLSNPPTRKRIGPSGDLSIGPDTTSRWSCAKDPFVHSSPGRLRMPAGNRIGERMDVDARRLFRLFLALEFENT